MNNAHKINQAKKPKPNLRQRLTPKFGAKPPTTPIPSAHDAEAQHSRSSSSTCGASRNIAGTVHFCTLKPLHGGPRHNDGDRTWRTASGDAE